MPAMPYVVLRAFLCAVLLSHASCRGKKAGETASESPRIEEMSRDGVKITMTFDPPRVHLERDMLVSLKITAPTAVDVQMPSLSDRLTGFQIAGVMDGERTPTEDSTVHERRILLTPLVSDEYRVAPLPIIYTDHRRTPPASGWFPTKPVVLDPAPAAGKHPSDILETLSPIWIRPSSRTIGCYFVLLVVAAIAAWGAWKLMLKIRRAIRLRKMSPKARALFELDELLAEKLVEKGKVKDFYLRLTLIVRMYIERAHGIRAPEQTTEEFLSAASKDSRFSKEVLSLLKAFLEAADLVKFAAHRPDPEAIANSIATARNYIQSDSAERPQGGP